MLLTPCHTAPPLGCCLHVRSNAAAADAAARPVGRASQRPTDLRGTLSLANAVDAPPLDAQASRGRASVLRPSQCRGPCLTCKPPSRDEHAAAAPAWRSAPAAYPRQHGRETAATAAAATELAGRRRSERRPEAVAFAAEPPVAAVSLTHPAIKMADCRIRQPSPLGGERARPRGYGAPRLLSGWSMRSKDRQLRWPVLPLREGGKEVAAAQPRFGR
eukprot:351737-Chlamydomonas_euryale.AAC.6